MLNAYYSANNSPVSIIFMLLGYAVNFFLTVGVTVIMLNIYDNKQATLKDLYADPKIVWNYFLATVLYMLIVVGGTILLIIPGIIWGIKYGQYKFLVVDKKLTPWESIKQSGYITNGARWNLFYFYIVIGLLNVVGMLALGIGLIVTIPISMMATVFVYRKLLQKDTHQEEQKEVEKEEVIQQGM